MQVKTMPPMKVLSYTTKTTFAGIDVIAAKIPMALQAEAVRLQLWIAGPQQWCYYGADGNPNTEFTLEIILPVYGDMQQSTEFKLKEVPAFKCAATMHVGNWDQLPATYCKIIPEVLSQGMQMKDDKECREVYLNCDFDNRANCLTEVQIGIQ